MLVCLYDKIIILHIHERRQYMVAVSVPECDQARDVCIFKCFA